MEEYGFVYIWYDKKHKRYYIGSHWGTEDDGYICSSSWMKQAHKKRKIDFKRRILETYILDKKKLLIQEEKWLSLIKDNEIGKRYYNLKKCAMGGATRNGQTHSEETKIKIGNGNRGKKHSDEFKERIRNRRIGTIQSKESNLKRSEALKGRKLSEETKLKLSIASKGRSPSFGMKGKKHSTETKEKMRQRKIGRIWTEEQKQKLKKSKKKE